MTEPVLSKFEEQQLAIVDMAIADQLLLAKTIRQACVESGFFYLINHGIDQKLVDEVFVQSKRFFDLPLAEKMKVSHDVNHRGYTPMAEEILDPLNSKQGDAKEGYYIGWDLSVDDPLSVKPLHGPNQWPSEGDFRTIDGLEGNHAEVLLRGLLNFHALTKENLDVEHIQIMICKDKDAVPRVWEDVAPMQGAFIVNLGDMLERWTNGLFRSTLHRVLSKGVDRYSVPVFYEPNFDTIVECLPTCCTASNPPKYPPITSGDHLLGKYIDTHSGYDTAAKPLA